MHIYFFSCTTNKFTIPYLAKSVEDEAFLPVFFSSADELRKKMPDSNSLILFSFLISDLELVKQTIKSIRNIGIKSLIIAGGQHVDGDPAAALKYIECDYAVTGYAQSGFIGKIKEHLKNNPSTKIIKLSEPTSLDDIPTPLSMKFRPPLEIRRGCTNNCAFCKTGKNKKVLIRSRESIGKYFKDLKAANYDRVQFITPSAFRSESFEMLEWVLGTAKTDYKFKFVEYGIFPSEADPKDVNPNWLKLIKKYCSNKKITIGCQSASPSMLKKINRAHSLDDIEQACACINEHELRPVIDFIIGLPGEELQDWEETKTFILKLNKLYNPIIQAHYFMPLPGTDLADQSPTKFSNDFIEWLNTAEDNGIIKGNWKLHYGNLA